MSHPAPVGYSARRDDPGIASLMGMWLLCCLALLAGAVELPPRARSLLDRKYAEWRMAPSAPQIESWFEQYMPAFRPNLVFGDFNRDGRTDYAVQVISGGKQHVVAFVASTTGYSMMPLSADDPDPFTFLVIYKRGEKDFDFEHMKPFRYSADALGVLYLKKTAVTYSWSGKQFARREAPGDEEVEAARADKSH